MAEQGQRKLTKEERAIKLLKKDNFVHNAVQIVVKAVEITAIGGAAYSHLLDKMLHSIYFLGNIHNPWFQPKDVFNDRDIFEKMKLYKEPLAKYTTEVPLRTPFSYFLEMVVSVYKNEDDVKGVLSNTLQKCKCKSDNQYTLISSVICISQVYYRKYYGGSLSCPGDIEREIMTAVSCFHVWDNYVSSAVLDVFPEDKTEPRFPRGNMTLPRSVQCRAYGIGDLSSLKAPCARCGSLYSLPNSMCNRNYPGNCAETEAISNLLKNEKEVKSYTTMQGDVFTSEVIKANMRTHFNAKVRVINRGHYRIDSIYNSIKGRPRFITESFKKKS